MTKEQLELRIQGLKKDMDLLRANYSKLEGHLEESTFWLNDLIYKETNPDAQIIDSSIADLHQSEQG